ncbi:MULTISPECIES: type III secretion system export apparatus subunit SctT [Rhodomicrobium]|uniref:type III secretion system export apparatus subunit SctT n=1 Tax=Rhodomicrobium TaxID=1068 RepID=UPI000B4B27E7|nr:MULTISPECIES: type III secretion system export apparatus subunit SctT [Rhodomicrobium]
MNTELALTDVHKVEIYLIASGMALSRMIGMVSVMPAFTRIGLTGILRTGVALVLSLPMIPLFVDLMLAQNMPFGQVAAILFKEVMVGILIGIVLGIPIWAAEAAGEILDLQRGATFAEIVDPLSTTTNNITGTFFAIVIVAIYFASGGLGLTLRTVYESYAVWPLLEFMPIFSAQASELLLQLLDQIFGMGLLLVSPMVIAFLLADISLALVARAAPQLNIFILSLTVKNLTFVILLVLYGSFLLTYMRNDLGWIINAGQRLEQFAPKRD